MLNNQLTAGLCRWFRNNLAGATGRGVRCRRPRSAPLSTVAAEVEPLESRKLLTVTYQGGALLAAVETQAVYLGSDWNTSSPLQTTKGQLETFNSMIVNSAYMDMLTSANYNVGRGTNSAGAVGNFVLDKTNGITDAQIQGDLQAMITAGQVQTPDANRLYLVYVEAGVVISAFGSNSSTGFTGYHNAFAGKTTTGAAADIRYALIAYPGAPNYGSSGDLGQMTRTTSHEMAEAVTDPDVDYKAVGWYDDTLGGEIADLSHHATTTLNGYSVELVVNQNDQVIYPPDPVSSLATPSLTAAAASPTTANLTWGAVSQAVGYRVYEVNGAQTTLLTTVGSSATSYQVTGLMPASTVSFYVEAYNGTVVADSAQASVTLPLAAPNPTTASAMSTTAANVTWGAVSQAAGYRVYQVNGTLSTLIGTLGASATTYQATGLTSGSTVSFFVEAYNGSVVADSTVASVTLTLGTPALTANAASPTAANLSWSAASLTQGYRVYKVIGTQTTLVTTLGASTKSYQASGLTSASTVAFYVEAYNGSVVADSAKISVTLPLAKPILNVTSGSSTTASLSWSLVSQALGYRVYEVIGTQKILLGTVSATTTSFQVTGLTNGGGSTVSFMVEAFNGTVFADSAVVSVMLKRKK